MIISEGKLRAGILKNISRRFFALIIIFIISLTFRLFVFHIDREHYLGGMDAIGYHNSAIRMVHNGLDFNHFGEPLYSCFVAVVYKVYELSGRKATSINDMFSDKSQHPEIFYLIIVQIIISALSCVLFYITIKKLIRPVHSFFIACLSAIYFPLAVQCRYMYRETFLICLLLVANYFFLKYLLSKNIRWLVLFSISWGLCNYAFQATYFFLLFFIFIFILVRFKNLKHAILMSLLSFGIMFVVITPWIIDAYRCYPNLNILKTMGYSLTYESLAYVEAERKATFYGLQTLEQEEAKLYQEWYSLDDKERFERSFSGYYKSKVNSINNMISEPLFSRRVFIQIWQRFRLSWVRLFFGPQHPSYHINPIKRYSGRKILPLVISGLIFGYLSIPSLFIFYPKIYPMLLIFTYFLSFFYILGSETRRMSVTHPFLLMFSYLFVFFLYRLIFKKGISLLND